MFRKACGNSYTATTTPKNGETKEKKCFVKSTPGEIFENIFFLVPSRKEKRQCCRFRRRSSWKLLNYYMKTECVLVFSENPAQADMCFLLRFRFLRHSTAIYNFWNACYLILLLIPSSFFRCNFEFIADDKRETMRMANISVHFYPRPPLVPPVSHTHRRKEGKRKTHRKVLIMKSGFIYYYATNEK